MKKKILIIGLLLCSYSTYGFAEEVVNTEDEETREIVVTASRVPQSVMDVAVDVQVVKPADWQNKGATTVAEALVGVPGVVVQSYGGAGSTTLVKINGTERIVVLVDGKRMNLPQGSPSGAGTFDLKDIALGDSIERIEVVRGGGSALYGSDAVGGVIQIITKQGQGKPVSQITLSGGDDEKFKMNFMTSGSNKKEHWRVSTDYFSTDGQRENSFSRAGNLSLRWDHDINLDSSWYVTYDHTNDKSGLPNSLKFPSTVDYRKSKTDVIGAGYTNKNMKLQVYQINKNQTGFSFSDFEYKNQTQTIDYQDSRDVGKNHQMTWGAQLKKDHVSSTSYAQTGSTHSEAVFLQDQIKVGKKLLLTPGVRYERNSEYGKKWTPKVGAVYQPKEQLSFYANWGKVFKTPSFDDRYWYENWGGGMGMFGNPNLNPETGWTTEAGVKYQLNKNHFVSATFFHRELNDAIKWVDVSGFGGTWSTMNVDSYRTQGFTVAWNGKMGKYFSMDANYTYQDTDATVNYNESRHQFHMGLHYKRNKWSQSLLFDAQSTTENGLGAKNGVSGFAVISSTTEYQINDKNKVFFTVYNLANKEYQSSYDYPADKRNFLIGWKMKF